MSIHTCVFKILLPMINAVCLCYTWYGVNLRSWIRKSHVKKVVWGIWLDRPVDEAKHNGIPGNIYSGFKKWVFQWFYLLSQHRAFCLHHQGLIQEILEAERCRSYYKINTRSLHLGNGNKSEEKVKRLILFDIYIKCYNWLLIWCMQSFVDEK